MHQGVLFSLSSPLFMALSKPRHALIGFFIGHRVLLYKQQQPNEAYLQGRQKNAMARAALPPLQLGSIKSLKFHVSRIIKKCIGNQSRIYDRRMTRRSLIQWSNQVEFVTRGESTAAVKIVRIHKSCLSRHPWSAKSHIVETGVRCVSSISTTCSTHRTGLKNSSARLIPCVEHMLCLSHHYYGWLSPWGSFILPTHFFRVLISYYFWKKLLNPLIS